jgi:exodeoxyribonuclease-3
MALHRKYESLLALDPDVAIIPECSNPELLAQKAPAFIPSSVIWSGENPNKGLGVFTFGSFMGTKASIHQPDIPFIVPIRIDCSVPFNLLAVWACHSKSNSYVQLMGPLKRALNAYRAFVESSHTIVAGDFNDNVLWDKPTKANNHGENVAELNRLGLQSAYHFDRAIEQGCEEEKTLYWRNRTAEGPKYHIDYCFVPRDWTKSIISVTVGRFEDWVGKGLSDHVPLIVDVNP